MKRQTQVRIFGIKVNMRRPIKPSKLEHVKERTCIGYKIDGSPCTRKFISTDYDHRFCDVCDARRREMFDWSLRSAMVCKLQKDRIDG